MVRCRPFTHAAPTREADLPVKFHAKNTPALPANRKGQSGKVLLCPQQDNLATSVAHFCIAVLSYRRSTAYTSEFQHISHDGAKGIPGAASTASWINTVKIPEEYRPGPILEPDQSAMCLYRCAERFKPKSALQTVLRLQDAHEQEDNQTGTNLQNVIDPRQSVRLFEVKTFSGVEGDPQKPDTLLARIIHPEQADVA